MLVALQKANRFDDIVSATAGIIAQHPGVYEFHVVRGIALMKLDRLEDAALSFGKVLELRPDEPNTLHRYGQCLFRTGRGEEAVGYFARDFELHPSEDSGYRAVHAMLLSQAPDVETLSNTFKRIHADFFASRPDHTAAVKAQMPIGEWCKVHTPPILEYDAAQQVSLTDAQGNALLPYDVGANRFAILPDAGAIAGFGSPIAPTGEILDDSYAAPLDTSRFSSPGEKAVPFAATAPTKRVLLPWASTEVVVDEDVLFLSSPRLNHFGHWIYDHLPRLRAWSSPNGKKRKIFVPNNLMAAQRETLALFGIGPSNIIEGEIGRRYRFKSLAVWFPMDPYKPGPSVTAFLYRHLAPSQTAFPEGTQGDWIYLERSQTHRGRAVTNQEEFSAVLADFGVKTIRRPEISVPEQNEMFSRAGVIITPFGTDSVTMFQVRPHTDMVTLDFEDLEGVYPGIQNALPRYCAILKVPLHSVPGQLVKLGGRQGYHADLSVDCSALRRTLEAIRRKRNGRG
jgi:hypothetical protein